jgi:hypothetical protein
MDRIVEQIGEPGGLCFFIETYSGRTGSHALLNEGGDTLATGTLEHCRDEAERITAAEQRAQIRELFDTAAAANGLPHDWADPEAKW